MLTFGAMKNVDIILFEPKVADMRHTYPELKGISEFERLNSSELKMCWMIGSPTSPLRRKLPSEKDKPKRIKFAVESSFQEEYIESNKKVKNFRDGKEIPQDYKAAIQRFASFDVSFRLRSRFLALEVMSNLESMLLIDKEELQDYSADEYKSYATVAKQALELLPKLMAEVEGAFGLTIIESKSDDDLNFDDEKVVHKAVASIDDLED